VHETLYHAIYGKGVGKIGFRERYSGFEGKRLDMDLLGSSLEGTPDLLFATYTFNFLDN